MNRSGTVLISLRVLLYMLIKAIRSMFNFLFLRHSTVILHAQKPK